MKNYGLNRDNTPAPIEKISAAEIAEENRRASSIDLKIRLEALKDRIARVTALRSPPRRA